MVATWSMVRTKTNARINTAARTQQLLFACTVEKDSVFIKRVSSRSYGRLIIIACQQIPIAVADHAIYYVQLEKESALRINTA